MVRDAAFASLFALVTRRDHEQYKTYFRFMNLRDVQLNPVHPLGSRYCIYIPQLLVNRWTLINIKPKDPAPPAARAAQGLQSIF